MDEIVLRPLEFELGLEHLYVRSGHHDMRSWQITLGTRNHSLASTHESLHDRAIYETPFGTVQAAFRRASQQAEEPPTRHEMDLWSTLLIANSRETHERHATYLSIKVFPMETHGTLLNMHPAKYRRYFHDVSEVVDPVFKSSYLQYLVGTTILEICFASRLQERLCEWTLGDAVELAEDESPNWRFRSIGEFCSESRMSELMEYLQVWIRKSTDFSFLPTGFRMNVEDHWLSLPMGLSNRLDLLLQGLIREWLYGRAVDILPCLDPAEWLDTRHRFFDRVSEQLRLRLSWNDVDVSRATKDSLSPDVREIRASHSTIANTYPGPKIPVEWLPADADPVEAIMRFKADTRFFISDTTHGTLQSGQPSWICNLGVGNAVTRIRLSHLQMCKILEYNRMCAVSTGYTPPYDGIIVRFSDFGGKPIPSVYEEVIGFHLVEFDKGTSPFNTDKIFWYMSGSLLEWYNILRTQGKMEFMHLFWDAIGEAKPDPDFRFPDLDSAPNRLAVETFMQSEHQRSLLMIESERLLGTFCRIVSMGSTLGAGRFMISDLKNGMISFPWDKADLLAAKGLNVVKNVLVTWDVL